MAQALAAEFLRSGATVAGAAEIFGYSQRIKDAVGNALEQFALRVLGRLTGKTLVAAASDPSWGDLEQIALDAVEAAIQSAAGSVDEILKAHNASDAPPGSDAQAYTQLRVSLYNLSRIMVTHVREQAKHDAATGYGATGRTWRTRRDNRVRPSHQILEGVFRRAGLPFDTGAAELMFPGDPTAPLEERMGCRCRLLWRLA